MSFTQNSFIHLHLEMMISELGDVKWECSSCGALSFKTWTQVTTVATIRENFLEHVRKSHNRKAEDFEEWS